MKRTTPLLSLLFLILVMNGCACQRVPQGFTGVFARNYGDDKGGIEEVGPGKYHYNPVTTDLYQFPNFVQRVAWTQAAEEDGAGDEAIRVMSADQLEFAADVGFSYYVSAAKGCSGSIFRKYRKEITAITAGPIRDVVRNNMQSVFSQHPADFIYGTGRPVVVAEIESGIRATLADMKTETGESCFIIEDFALNRIDPPQSVKEAVERKIQATQRAQEERENLQQVIYKSQQDSIKAVMDARNNERLAASIDDRLLRLKWLEKWDGKLPQVMGEGVGGVMLDLK